MMGAQTATARQGQPVSTKLFLLVVASTVFVSALTGSMINVVLPVMRSEFGASAAQIGWVVTGFALTYAIGVPLYGRISDIFGIRPVFAFGLLGFIAGGFICAFAPSLAVLVFGRIVQAAGGAAIPALASVAAAKVLPDGQRGGALGLVASSVGLGATAGPILGGVVGQFLGWRALFLGSLLMMLVLIPVALRVLPNGGSAAGKRHFDLLGGILLGFGAGLFLFGITQGQTAGFGSFSAWGSFLGAALAIAGFIWRIHKAPEPFAAPALFMNRAYTSAMLVAFFAMLANLAAIIFATLLVIEVNGLPPSTAGLLLTPGAIALAFLSPFAGRLSDRIGVRSPIIGGLSLMLLSLLFLSTFAGASPILIMVGVLGVGAGFAFIQSPNYNAAAGALPPKELGVGMGMLAGTFFLGAGTGPALFGALFEARQGAGLAAINPLYSSSAAAYSDVFLAMALALIVALVGALGLRKRGRPS
jgi:DHA2 family metal-tetracycline-proton antiporter-like MFS transporter